MNTYGTVSLEKFYFPELPFVSSPIIKNYSRCPTYSKCRENCGSLSCDKYNYTVDAISTTELSTTELSTTELSTTELSTNCHHLTCTHANTCTHSNTRTNDIWSHLNKRYDSVRKCLDCGTQLSVY